MCVYGDFNARVGRYAQIDDVFGRIRAMLVEID